MGGLVQHGCLLISIVLASSSVSTAENTFPPDSSSFLSVSAGSVTLHLDALVEEGAPTTYFVVEYKPKATENWILAWDNVHPGGDFVVLDLSPATWYDLKVTSHNDDGDLMSPSMSLAHSPPEEVLRRHKSNLSTFWRVLLLLQLL